MQTSVEFPPAGNINPAELQTRHSEWRPVYKTGAVCTLIVLVGILTDMIAGFITGGNISVLPRSAIGRFDQIHQNWMLGLYNLDLLNMINQVFLIPAFFALYAAHRKTSRPFAMLALVIFLSGTVIFVLNNSALAVYDLSQKYFSASAAPEKMFYAAGGEAILAKGEHGSLSVFPGFLLPNIGILMISFVMLKAKIFSKWTAWAGISGSILIILYIILVTFSDSVKSNAAMYAALPGLLLMIWMILFMIKLFRLE